VQSYRYTMTTTVATNAERTLESPRADSTLPRRNVASGLLSLLSPSYTSSKRRTPHSTNPSFATPFYTGFLALHLERHPTAFPPLPGSGLPTDSRPPIRPLRLRKSYLALPQRKSRSFFEERLPRLVRLLPISPSRTKLVTSSCQLATANRLIQG
jgi:hypothetical protein